MEKVLGFKEKDSCYNKKAWLCRNCGLLHEEAVKECCSNNTKIKLVPVVSIEHLKKLRSKRLKEMLDRDEERDFGNGYLCAIDEIIEEAERVK